MSRNIGQFGAKPESLTKKAKRSYYDKEPIRQFLEDREDYLTGVAVRAEGTDNRLGELERGLGLTR